jgi:hypothetical protein
MIDILKNKKFLIFDNILSNEHQDNTEKIFFDKKFPWYLTPNLKTVDDTLIKKYKNKKNIIDYMQFVHTFYDYFQGETSINSPKYNVVLDILKEFMNNVKIDKFRLMRAKANLTTQHKKNNKNIYNSPHIDVNENHLVLIYYVNDSDGDTILFDKKLKIFKKISPKKGRFLLFDGSILHTGQHPIKNDIRVLINFDLGYVNE